MLYQICLHHCNLHASLTSKSLVSFLFISKSIINKKGVDSFNIRGHVF